MSCGSAAAFAQHLTAMDMIDRHLQIIAWSTGTSSDLHLQFYQECSYITAGQAAGHAVSANLSKDFAKGHTLPSQLSVAVALPHCL